MEGHANMKVSVLGAGAVGSVLGGLIQHHDPSIDMRLIALGPHGEAMRRDGRVVLKGEWGTREVPVRSSEDLQEIADSDYILLLVKSQLNEQVLEKAKAWLGKAVVISVQNGVHQHRLRKYIAPERLFVGMTATNMAILEPGVVSLQRNGLTVIGPCSANTPSEVTAGALALMRKTGLAVDVSANIPGVQYNKLLLNTMGYASVLSATNFITEGILHRPWRQAIAEPILAEGLATLHRAGIKLERTVGFSDILRFRRLLRLLDARPLGAAARLVVTRIVKPKPLVYSVYQDLARGDRTEIEFINGEIVRLAREHGGEAPRNALVVQMVHELEARGDGTFFTRDEVLSRFAALPPREYA
jgi:2-dehydropantoate 2-reductase